MPVFQARKAQMKILKYLMATFLLSALNATATDIANFGMYEQANRRVMEQPNSGTRVIMMGNSITYLWNGAHPDFFVENDFICRGIGGQSTYEMLLRFREDVVNLEPAGVVIAGGTNDVAENLYPYDERRTFGNILSMVEIARANNIEVFLASVLPAAGFRWNTAISDAKDKIENLNALMREYADINDIPYIDYYSAMTGRDRELYEGFTSDGVHPNEAGYAVMERILLPVIRERIPLDGFAEASVCEGGEEPSLVKVDPQGRAILLDDAVIHDVAGSLVAEGSGGDAIGLKPGCYIASGTGKNRGVTKFNIR